ncbi:unnamed protein product [Protopolystoma xenopodis]|uniref:AMP-dependent synthetase/ligase domain-containing protein n=1 Tax=Protopolystoma xenopodis TaxID=117903 RepID=A0A448WCT5_9PLAT|nr:unnamed protein product [Protopolystoma xenopodis]
MFGYKEGALKIVDRCKNIFKLSQGEYVAPEKLERVYAQSPYIDQIFVDGNSICSYPVALVLPTEKGAREYLKQMGLLGEQVFVLPEAITNPGFMKAVIEDMLGQAAEEGLCGFEKFNQLICQAANYFKTFWCSGADMVEKDILFRPLKSPLLKKGNNLWLQPKLKANGTSGFYHPGRNSYDQQPRQSIVMTIKPIKKLVLNQVLLERIQYRGLERVSTKRISVKKIAFINEPFSMGNGLMTPTLKMRRGLIKKKYATTLASLYDEGLAKSGDLPSLT